MRFANVRLLIEMRSPLGCRRGQVVVIFAFAVTMLVIALGMGIDLWQGFVVKARLQSAVDAAALAIASTDRTQYTLPQLNTRTLNYINTNYPSSALGELCSAPGSSIVCPPNPLYYGATPNIINVTYAASVPTAFMRIIGYNNMQVTATGQAKAAWPYINFYLLLDDSPSMAIAATGAGVTTMVNNTAAQGGCAFACHQLNPSADSLGNPAQASSATCNPPNGYPSGGEDNFALARCLGVVLRIDMLQQAVANLMTTAQTTENNNSIVNEYGMAIYTFDTQLNTIFPLGFDLTAAATAASNIQLVTVYSNNVKWNPVLTTTGNTHSSTTLNSLASTTGVAVGQHVIGAGIPAGATITAKSGSSVTLSSAATATATGVTVNFGTTTNNSDEFTNYTNAMNQMAAIFTANPPGQGTQSPGDTPKEVLFFVTDGVEDQNVAGCTTSGGGGANAPYVTCSGNRQQSAMNPSYCTTIKNMGVLIAVLYTEYDALPTNSWYNSYVSPYNQPAPPQTPDLSTDHSTGIADSLFQCASPGLYTKVATGGDISAALNQLFITAVNSVFLSQ
jgi:Flp pilus assembly protein TadG